MCKRMVLWMTWHAEWQVIWQRETWHLENKCGQAKNSLCAGVMWSVCHSPNTYCTHARIKQAQAIRHVHRQGKYAHTHARTHTHTLVPATSSPWPSGPVCRWFSEHGPPLMLPPGCQSPQSRNLWLVFTWRDSVWTFECDSLQLCA